MKWFGQSWGAPICDPVHHVTTPVDEICMYWHCEKPIQAHDQGILIPHMPACGHWLIRPWHIDCYIKSIGGKP